MRHHALLSKFKNLNLLYVEDDPLVRHEISEFLKRYFALVDESSSAEEAMDIFKKDRPHIMLVDINLPGESGLSLVMKIRKKYHDVRIIVSTAYTNKEFLLLSIELELTRYLVKPVTGERLLEALEKAADEYLLIAKKEEQVELGEGFYFDKKQRILRQNNETIILRAKEMQLLEYFMLHPKEIISYDMFEYDIWEDSSMSHDAIRSQIRNIRKKTHHKIIENINGIGYRLYIKEER